MTSRLFGERFFYGWIIVFITFITSMITSGISGYGLSFFVIPMSEDLGVSRAEFAIINVFRIALIPAIPLFGYLADKKQGPRLMLTFGSLIAGFALVFSSQVQSIWQFYLLYGIVVGLAMTIIGGDIVGAAVISKWFIRLRGRAMAFGTMGISAGGLIVAPFAGWLISSFDWRLAWVVLGLAIILFVAPASAIFMRRSPEDMGLLPDGDVLPSGHSTYERAVLEYSWTLKQALRTRSFWILLITGTLAYIAISSVLFHQVAYMQDKDFGIQTTAVMATTLAFFALIAKPMWGLFAEKIHIRWVMVVGFILSGISLLLLVLAQNVPMLLGYAIFHGLTMGGEATLMNVALATYFGRDHMGAIRGAVAPIGVIMGSLSPVFSGWLWTPETSYDLPFIILSVIWVLGGLIMLLAKPPVIPKIPT